MLRICRVAFAGIMGLASVAVSRAGEPIEIVPTRGSVLETNVQDKPAEMKSFDNVGPHAPRTFRLNAAPAFTPPPPQQRTAPLTEREKELLDRRRNWVFMSPDDIVGQAESDLSGGVLDDSKDGSGKKNTTVMERYYEHLYDSDRASATNQTGKLDSASWAGPTNSVVVDTARSSDGWFSTPSDAGVFQPPRGNILSDIFGSGGDKAQSPAETIRLQEAQKDHMESFKQLWDIDQPPSAAPAVSAALPAPKSPTPVFGSPSGGQPTINTFNASLGGLSGQAPATAEPALPTITSSRAIAPPRSTFTPPQREF